MGDTAGQLRVRDHALRVARSGGDLEQMVRALVGTTDRGTIDAASEALADCGLDAELSERALSLLRRARDTGLF